VPGEGGRGGEGARGWGARVAENRKTIRVGLAGAGCMGRTHAAAYRTLPEVELAAIADVEIDRLASSGGGAGNIAGQGAPLGDLAGVALHEDPRKLVEDHTLDIIDVCLPTPLHAELSIAALEAGKHVICEKPMARTVEEADRIVAAARKAAGFFMVAHCLRFWPEYVWARRALAEARFGRTLAASFRRLSARPSWGWQGWFADESRSGGALLDLHIHDIDVIRWFFGAPAAVTSRASSLGHVQTLYEYPGGPAVAAEGGWLCESGFPFEMSYLVVCERATMEFTSRRTPALLVYEGGQPKAPELERADAYAAEIAYFVRCVREHRRPDAITPEDAREAVRIAEAEARSSRTDRRVQL